MSLVYHLLSHWELGLFPVLWVIICPLWFRSCKLLVELEEEKNSLSIQLKDKEAKVFGEWLTLLLSI